MYAKKSTNSFDTKNARFYLFIYWKIMFITDFMHIVHKSGRKSTLFIKININV